MQKIISIIHKTALFVLVGIFLCLCLAQTWFVLHSYGITVESEIYWVLLALWIVVVSVYNRQPDHSLLVAFICTIVAALFLIIGIVPVSETIFRVSLVGWLVGLSQSVLLKYDK